MTPPSVACLRFCSFTSRSPVVALLVCPICSKQKACMVTFYIHIAAVFQRLIVTNKRSLLNRCNALQAQVCSVHRQFLLFSFWQCLPLSIKPCNKIAHIVVVLKSLSMIINYEYRLYRAKQMDVNDSIASPKHILASKDVGF